MNNDRKPTRLLKNMLCMLLAAGGILSVQAAANDGSKTQSEPLNAPDQGIDAPADTAGSAEQSGEDPPGGTAEEPAFPCSFNDVSKNLVLIECKSETGEWAGSGFVAKMDGKTYIFTNQHVILGADTIVFATVTGEILKPMGVELTVERDIARLPIADRADALSISSNILMGMPLGVFGNSEGGGVATELFGKVTGIGAELVEVTAEFVSGNSGSPVINADREVIGIASYVKFAQPSRMTENTRFENKTRRFCYRLTDVRWAPVRWRAYNEKYGREYCKTVALTESIVEIVTSLYEEPFGGVGERYLDVELVRWSSQHNRAIQNSGNERRRAVGSSTETLADYCKRKSRQLEIQLKNRDLTGFLRDEFEGYMHALQYAADAIDYFNMKLPAL